MKNMNQESSETTQHENPTSVTNEDLSYILGECGHGYTWDEFYKTRLTELENGKKNCPQASYIALELLTPRLMQMPWRSQRTTNETHLDFLQEAWVVIAEHIADYDESKSTFPTYISKWFTGLAREIRDNELTDYQKRSKGYRVYSADAIVAKTNPDDESNESKLEFADENSDIETIMEKKEKARTDELLHQALLTTLDGGDEICIDEENEQKKREAYANIACAKLFLGGIDAMPDNLKDRLEEVLRN